jgi:hypothetical protein
MLKTETTGRGVLVEIRAKGLPEVAVDLVRTVHAVSSKMEEVFGPGSRDALRAALLVTMSDQKLWSMKPDRIEDITEVDNPDDLMKEE